MIPLYLLLLVCPLLAGCGKKSAVEPVEESAYPRSYPKPAQFDFPNPKKPETASEPKEYVNAS